MPVVISAGGAFTAGAAFGGKLGGEPCATQAAWVCLGGGGEGSGGVLQGHGECAGGGGAPFAFACADHNDRAGPGDFSKGMAFPGNPDFELVSG